MAGGCATADEVIELGGGVSIPLAQVVAVVRRAALRKQVLFIHFPEVTRDDLVQQAMAAVIQSRGFKPTSSNWSTWVYTVAARTMIDLWRRRAKVADREGEYASDTEYAATSCATGENRDARRVPVVYPDEVIDPDEPPPETVDGEVLGSSDDLTLADWCAGVRRMALAKYGTQRVRVNFRDRRIAELAPLAMLAGRLNLSAVSMYWVLQHAPPGDRAGLRSPAKSQPSDRRPGHAEARAGEVLEARPASSQTVCVRIGAILARVTGRTARDPPGRPSSLLRNPAAISENGSLPFSIPDSAKTSEKTSRNKNVSKSAER
jgi:RNA polymerase sigma factor (sigma-70 family)